MKAPFEVTIPLRARTSQNVRFDHHMAKARRVKKERGDAMMATARLPALVEPALLVTLTYVGPRELDFVNLCASLKAVQDGVASRLKVDDASPLVKWAFAQERGEYAVKVEVTTMDADGALRARIDALEATAADLGRRVDAAMKGET